MDDREARRRVSVVEERLAALEELGEPGRTVALDAVQQLVELYGESLARLLGHARSGLEAEGRNGARSEAFDRALAGDELLGHLLLLHDLHPVDPASRIEAALSALRPQLASRAATVALASVEGPVARLEFGAAKPLPEALIALFEEAVVAAAPEIERVESVGAVAEKGFVPLGSLQRRGGAA